MKLLLKLKGATEPQFKITFMDSDDMRLAVNVIRLLDSNGLLYAPIEDITIQMDDTEYISLQ